VTHARSQRQYHQITVTNGKLMHSKAGILKRAWSEAPHLFQTDIHEGPETGACCVIIRNNQKTAPSITN
jgi:hypothetical protein